MPDYFHYQYQCPYISGTDGQNIFCRREEDRRSSRVYCPSVASCRKYVRSYCADPQGYKKCSIARMLEETIEIKLALKKGVRKCTRKKL